MTVAQLIKELRRFPKDMLVIFRVHKDFGALVESAYEQDGRVELTSDFWKK